MGLADLLDELDATKIARAGRPPAPGVIAASGDVEDVAEGLDGERLPVVSDEGELHVHSFTKEVAALF